MKFINSIAKNSKIAFFSANFWWIFFRISRQIPENSDVCRFFNQICENKSEICRKFWILWKKFTIISELFTSLLIRHEERAGQGALERRGEGVLDVHGARAREDRPGVRRAPESREQHLVSPRSISRPSSR